MPLPARCARAPPRDQTAPRRAAAMSATQGQPWLAHASSTAYPAADDGPDPDLAHLARRAGREPARIAAHTSPLLAPPDDPRGSFVFSEPTSMTSTTLDTDLLTPLAAYLRVRRTARASFLLESVDQGRLGRHSFVGCGDRI